MTIFSAQDMFNGDLFFEGKRMSFIFFESLFQWTVNGRRCGDIDYEPVEAFMRVANILKMENNSPKLLTLKSNPSKLKEEAPRSSTLFLADMAQWEDGRLQREYYERLESALPNNKPVERPGAIEPKKVSASEFSSGQSEVENQDNSAESQDCGIEAKKKVTSVEDQEIGGVMAAGKATASSASSLKKLANADSTSESQQAKKARVEGVKDIGGSN